MTDLIKGLQKRYRTDFLFVNPSFTMGLGSILNIEGNYFHFNYSENAEQADTKALESDWGMVGQDIEYAIEEFSKDFPKVKSPTNGQ
jgi:hypothetical protein